jgi:small subunit ribosomal protein S8
MVRDPIADLLTRIRNAGLAGHRTVVIPLTKMSLEILEIFYSQNYIDVLVKYADQDFSKRGLNTNNVIGTGVDGVISTKNLFFCSDGRHPHVIDRTDGSRLLAPPCVNTDSLNGALLVFLSYVQKEGGHKKKYPKIETLKRISKSSRRVHWKFENMPRIQDGFGFAILTTSGFGLITDCEAREKRVGGEVLLAVTRSV